MEHGAQPTEPLPVRGRGVRGLTETKQALATTEFWIYAVVLLSLLIAGIVADGFGADHVWLYATLLTIGYMVSRGLAKSGSHDPYSAEQAGTEGSRGDRGRAAAQVLKEGETGSHAATPPPERGRGL
jgi:hypothetical protein